MTAPDVRRWLPFALSVFVSTLIALTWPIPRVTEAAPPEDQPGQGSLRQGDRVAWVGSSSTRIGVWPRTVEFLLRTRHPELDMKFQRFTTGGGTFATGLEHLDEWLGGYHPTVVIFNYGGNDANAGREGLAGFQDNMDRSVQNVRDRGARVILVTPQAADVRKSGPAPAARRTLYAETMLGYGRERGLSIIDVYHPLDLLQRANEKIDPDYTILKDKIHLTDAAYVAWGTYFFDRLDLPLARSEAVLSATGKVIALENCEIQDLKVEKGVVQFTRIDKILPILPPVSLPPRLSVPLESHSLYLLTVTDLEPGSYEIRCEGEPIGVVKAEELGLGVNLNTVLLDGGHKAPWDSLAKEIWEGNGLDRIGTIPWKFEIRKQ